MRHSTFAASLILIAASAPADGAPAASAPPTHTIDHIGIGTADLEKGIAFVFERTGVRAVKGGVHPGRGTQNALLSLGGTTYLEIFAPVPGAKLEGEDAELLKLTTPKPVFYAVRSTDLAETARMLKEKGYATTELKPGSRKRADGSVLKWRTFGISGAGLDAAPFFIEWDRASPHPSTTSPGGCKFGKLEVFDKDASALAKLFALLGVNITAQAGPAPALRVALDCPKGEVVFGP
jgi:catechol 2,3-dioxygenase-like lactoylglutathione lyase family enzyme